MTDKTPAEPWLRGTLTDVPPVQRAVLHALDSAYEDLERWCAALSNEQWNARPFGLAPLSFHIRHIVGSIDRLLTYAEGRQLDDQQLRVLKGEMEPDAEPKELFAALKIAIAQAANRIRTFHPAMLSEPRSVGRRKLPTTVAGLLVHVADHTQRHVGQAITTAKIITAATR